MQLRTQIFKLTCVPMKAANANHTFQRDEGKINVIPIQTTAAVHIPMVEYSQSRPPNMIPPVKKDETKENNLLIIIYIENFDLNTHFNTNQQNE